MSDSDVDVTSSVRKVLVKNWVDVAKVRIRVTGGLLTLSGTVAKAHGGTGDDLVDVNFLTTLDHALQHVKGLRRVRYNFANWSKDGGEWVVPVG
jgi:hypothetical protein